MVTKVQRILFIAGFHCLTLTCHAQDSITVNDVKVIKARSEITIERYLNNLLNTISYTGAESTDIKELITQSVEDSDKRIFLNDQIAVANDIGSPDYTNSSNSPDVPVIQYLNAFNTYYGKSDTNSVYFSDISSSHVKKGKDNIYINVYFTSFFKNSCLSNPSTPYKPAKRIAEMYVKRGANNKWVLYISRIGFFNPADTINEMSDDIVIVSAPVQTGSPGHPDETTNPADKISQYTDQARLEEKKRNYQAAILLYTKAIELAPGKGDIYETRIKELNTYIRTLADLEEKYMAGYYPDAVKGYSALLKKPGLNTDLSNSDYYLGRAKCYDKMGQLTRSYNEQVELYNKALKDYTKSYEYDNNNIETIRLRADLYRRMIRNLEALTEYRIYLAKDSTNLSVYEAMADLHMLTGNPDQAIKDIDLALSQKNIDPASASKLNIEKGILHIQKTDYSIAEDYFTRAIALDNKNAFSYYNRGVARVKMNRIQDAANDFMLVRQKGPGSYTPGTGRYDSALENYRRFIAFPPAGTPVSFDYEMGNIYLNMGKSDSAYSYLYKAFQMDSSNGYILYSIASCIYLRGNTEESLIWFERAFQTNVLKRSYVDQDALLGTLQNDKRFKDLKKKYLL